MSLPRGCALALALFAVAGCANHVRFSDEIRDAELRTVTRAVTRFERSARPLAEPRVALSISVDETEDVRRRETLVRVSEETPWRARDELWEVPAGLFAVPLFVAIRGSDKLFLGLIPDDFIEDGSDFAFASLNPALNVESDARLDRREVSRKSRDLERSLERVTRPLANTPLVVSLGDGPSLRLATDAAGHADVELLSVLRAAPARPPRTLRIEVPAEGVRARATLELPIARPLGARLVRAARVREAARKPGISPDRVAQALVELDALGFPEGALSLERELRERQHANAAWLSRLDLALEDP
jgi:hypothetical protein